MPPKKRRGPPPRRKIPSVNQIKDEIQPPSFKPPAIPETPQHSFQVKPPSAPESGQIKPPLPPHPAKLTKQKSGRQNDWFSNSDKQRRSSANLGKALLASGLLDKDTSKKMFVINNLRKKSTSSIVQRAANKWKKQASLQNNGYVVARSPSGDTVQVNHELMDNAGFYELKNDCSFQRALPDNDEWIEILNHHARRRTKFIDPNFQPNSKSLFRNGKKTKSNAGLGKLVTSWRRISDIFHQKYILHLKFTESERVPECYGYENGVKKLPPMILNNENAKNSLKMAKFFVETVMRESDPVKREKAILKYGGPMGKSILQRDLFQGIAEHHLPMEFSHISDDETYVVDRQVRSGYVNMVKIQITICFDPPHGIHLFDIHEDGNMVGAGDVCQGQIGDCYLMGALSVLSRIPSQVMNLFPSCKQKVLENLKYKPPQEYNNAGVYAVKFWRGNAWRVVVVDDYIPCGDDGLPCFANLSADSCEFWPLIVEKAYAKLNGSYEAIISGKENQALQDLTGGVPIIIDIGNKIKDNYKGEDGNRKLWGYLNSRMDEGSHIGISKSANGLPGRSTQIPAQHAYGILKLVLLNEQTPLVKIRNPWGKGKEWRGAYSDSDPIWDTMSKNEKERLGYTELKDGTWWMSFQDLLCEFDELSVCRLMDGFQVHHVVGHWRNNTASGRNAAHLSPQFHLHLGEGGNEGITHVVVEVRQPSHRDVGGNVYEAIAPVISGNADRHNNIYLEPRLGKSGFMPSRSAVVEIDCLKLHDPLSISPVTWNEGYESMFYIDIYTNCKSELIACNDNDLPRDPTTGELLKGSIISYDDKDGKKVFLLEKNQKKYLKQSSDICKHCNKPIMPTKGNVLGMGKFSGRYYTLDNGDKIHAECWDSYNKRNADKCIYCNAPIMEVKGKFSGSFFTINEPGFNGKVHEECMAKFQQKIAPKCLYCKKSICKIAGKFSGTFYTIPDENGKNGGKVHEECMGKYQLKNAPRCFKCKKPIVAGGLFSGSYYTIEGKGKIHKECYKN